MDQGMEGKLFGQIFANRGSVGFSAKVLPSKVIHIICNRLVHVNSSCNWHGMLKDWTLSIQVQDILEHSRLKAERQYRAHDVQDTRFHFTKLLLSLHLGRL